VAFCEVVDGNVTLNPAVAPLQPQTCRWNGQHDRPAFIMGATGGSIALQLAGSGATTSVAWVGIPPTFTNDQAGIDSVTQPLTSGQSALWVKSDTPNTNAGSVGGGVVAATPLPTALTTTLVPGTITFTQVALPPNANVDGTVHIRVGLVPVQ